MPGIAEKTVNRAWYARALGEVVDAFASHPESGLSQAEAAERLETFGPNQLARVRRWTRTKRLLGQFRDVLIWLLLGAAAVSGLVLSAWIDATAIGAIVILNAAIGYAQESRADRALESLRDLEAPSATVRRDGLTMIVDARFLVPGDLLILEAGNQVAADARLTSATRLLSNEAPLTGESLPVTKSVEPVDQDSVLGDRRSMVFAGTAIVSGRGRAIVTATGLDSEMGHIASLFSDTQPTTPLQVELARVGRRLAMVAVAAAILILGAGVLRSFPVETMILTAVALAVAAIPEGLPTVVTVSLAGGLQRMARQNAIVRRLPAVETLGAVNVVCTDKTGTLTAPELQVKTVVLPDGSQLDDFKTVDHLASAAGLCNDAYVSAEGLAGDPTEVALIVALEEDGIDTRELRKRRPRLDEAGFDGRRKRMSTIHESETGHVLLIKGAPEMIIERSTRAQDSKGGHALNEADRTLLLDQAENLAEGGMRTLAFGMRELDGPPSDPADSETDLTYLGMVGLSERIREEVPTALARAAEAGVTTVMVTGDHATTAEAVAGAIGLEPGMTMAGRELSDRTNQELEEVISGYRVFARVDPADKVKIIEAWKGAGATVAMTGDGVNDAPALHRADIGVAMGSGTDVARESAAMVLADDNYATIVSAIAEGRRLFNNLRNVVHYLLSANASEVLYVLAGFLIFGFLGEPLLAVQLLWINLISDALPAISLGMDLPPRDLMKERPGTGRDILSGRNMTLLLAQGTLLALAAFLAMIAGTYVLEVGVETARTMVFSTLVFSQLLHSLSVRAGSGPFRRPSRLLFLSLAGSALLQLVVIYTDLGQTLFRTTPLGVTAMGWTLAASLLSMALVRILNVSLKER